MSEDGPCPGPHSGKGSHEGTLVPVGEQSTLVWIHSHPGLLLRWCLIPSFLALFSLSWLPASSSPSLVLSTLDKIQGQQSQGSATAGQDHSSETHPSCRWINGLCFESPLCSLFPCSSLVSYRHTQNKVLLYIRAVTSEVTGKHDMWTTRGNGQRREQDLELEGRGKGSSDVEGSEQQKS